MQNDLQLDLPLVHDFAITREADKAKIAAIVDPKCNLCGRYAARRNIVMGAGDYAPTMMWIGPQPASDDDTFGRPYLGERGILLDRILKKAEMDRRQVYITYMVKCYADKVPKPKAKEAKACFNYLNKEIRSIAPKLVILEGPDVLKHFMGDRKANLTLLQGGLVTLEQYPGILFMPIYNIDAIYADSNHETQIVRNIKRGHKAAVHGVAPKIPTDYIYLETEEKLDTFIEMTKSYEYLSLDIETDGGPDFMHTKTVCWAVCWAPGKAAYFPWLDDGNTNHWPEERRKPLIDKWNKYLTNKKLILHNGKYDLKILRYDVGITAGFFFLDTLISSNIIDETQMSKKLKNLAWVYTDMGGYDDALERIKAQLKCGHDYSKIPRSILKVYVCGDVDCTFRIFMTQAPMLKEQNLEFLLYSLYMQVNTIFMELEYAGVYADRAHLMRVQKEYEDKIAQLTLTIHASVGKTFDITSDEQLAEILFTHLKLPVIRLTKTQESTDKDTLKKLKLKHPVIDMLLDYRATSTLLKTFVIPLLRLSEADNRIHTDYKVGVQNTSRTASAKPNLQNLPRKNKDIKKAFTARPGYIYYEFDFSQIEVRVLAHLSQDKKLLADLNSGLDIHRVMASTVYGIPPEQVTDDQRSNSKSVSFGIIYGMSWKTLAEDKGMSKNDAKKLYDNFFRGYPGVAQWIEDVKAYAREFKCVYTPLGRIRHLDGIDHPINSIASSCARCAVNSPIQSHGADITNLALINMLQTYPPDVNDYTFCFQIHDAVVLEMSETNHLELWPKIKVLLETTEPLCVPTPVGIKRGPSLGEMVELK
jgi:DNA polymerase-1